MMFSIAGALKQRSHREITEIFFEEEYFSSLITFLPALMIHRHVISRNIKNWRTTEDKFSLDQNLK